MHLALLLAAGLALAGPFADELAAMDDTLSDLEGMALSVDAKASTAAVQAGVRDLKQLQGQAAKARKSGSANHRVRVLTRLAEGQSAFFGALMDAPCPTGTEGDGCDFYRVKLAEKVVEVGAGSSSLAGRLREDLIVAGGGPDKLKGKEVRRAKAAQVALAAVMERAAAVPQPKRSVPLPPPPPPEQVFGQVGPAMDHPPAPMPSRDAADATPHEAGRYVQVHKTAVMSAQRDGGGAALKAAAEPGAGPVPETMLARLLEEDGERVLLEVGAGDHRFHCHHDPPWEAAIRVHLWADAAALHAVTVAPIEREHRDGSSVRLRPGALVVDEGVWADGLLLPLDLPPAAVGTAYPESGAFADPPAAKGVIVDDATKLSVLGRALPRSPVGWNGETLVWTDSLVSAPDGGELVGFHSTCGIVTLRAEQRDPHVDQSVGLGGLYGSGLGNVRIRVRAGTRLEWTDGTAAGVLAADIVRNGMHFPEKDDGRRCFDLEADWLPEGEADRPGRHLELCVAP
jgi:hypothetical protein